MNEDLQLVTSKEFNGVTLDCYIESGHEKDGEFCATREQIGRLLEYSEPMKSVAKIHERNKERLDKFSTIVKLTTVEGTRTVTREVTVYNFKGLLEICRYSEQPKANAVMDFLWEVADEIQRTGSYSAVKGNPELPNGVLEGAKLIFETGGIKGNQLALAMDKVYRSYTGRSALQAGEVALTVPTKKQILTPTEIGTHFGLKAQRVNEILAGAGFQHKINGKWEALPPGGDYAVMQDVGKKRGNGTPVRQLKWDSSILTTFAALMN